MIDNAASEKEPKKSQEDGVSFATRRPPSSYIGTRCKTNATNQSYVGLSIDADTSYAPAIYEFRHYVSAVPLTKL
jgi:hypothetical protein